MTIPDYVLKRVRRNAPEGASVLVGSTPVLAFGNPTTARVATLGLNPSDAEFMLAGAELDGDKRRFETLGSLRITSLAEAGDDHVDAIVRRCNDYFFGNPYRGWFDRLDEILRAIGATYYDRTACHLDLSQWATSPKWASIGATAREQLTRQDAPFLAQQLEHEGIETLLVNGRSASEGISRAFDIHLVPAGSVADRTVTTQLFIGHLNHTRIIAWSTNLQSSFGVTRQLRQALAQSVATLTAQP